MQKASSLTEFSQKWAIQALTVNQSIQKKVRDSEGSRMTHFSSETAWTPDNSNAFLKSGGCRIHDQPLPTFHRRHEPVSGWGKCHAQRTPGNTIPCLAKQAGKQCQFWEHGCLDPSANQWKPVLTQNPAKSPFKAGQLFSLLNAPFAQRSQDTQSETRSFLSFRLWDASAGQQFVSAYTELE